MRTRGLVGVLAVLAFAAPAAPAAVEGPVTRLAAAGGRADVQVRADGSAVAVWESAANVTLCRIAPGSGSCAAGSERVLAPGAAAGTATSRPFVLELSGNRIVVVRGECCPQNTYRWVSSDGGATFGTGVDFASVVPADQGVAIGPGEGISLLGEPARYQLAPASGSGKTTAEATLDSSAGLTGAHAVSLDPATGRPFALWGSATAAFFSGATTTSPNTTAAWPARTSLPGVTGMRLAGTLATWVRDGRHEVARWAGGGFGAGTPLPFAPPDAGEADVATDPGGGIHVVYTPAGTGAVCYAHGPASGIATAPVLLGRDSEGVRALQVSATGAGHGRVVFTTTAAGGPVSTLALARTSLTPNVCGLPPAGIALAKAARRATVRAAVDPAGQDTTFRVEYGPTTAYGSSTPEVAAPAAGGPVTSQVALADLPPGRTAHARVVATNATGTVTSSDLAFRNPALVGPATARQLIRFPARCVARRLPIAFPSLAGATPEVALVRVRGGRSLRTGAARLRTGRVIVTGLPRRSAVVRVKLRLDDGRILRATRSYARCG